MKTKNKNKLPSWEWWVMGIGAMYFIAQIVLGLIY